MNQEAQTIVGNIASLLGQLQENLKSEDVSSQEMTQETQSLGLTKQEMPPTDEEEDKKEKKSVEGGTGDDNADSRIEDEQDGEEGITEVSTPSEADVRKALELLLGKKQVKKSTDAEIVSGLKKIEKSLTSQLSKIQKENETTQFVLGEILEGLGVSNKINKSVDTELKNDQAKAVVSNPNAVLKALEAIGVNIGQQQPEETGSQKEVVRKSFKDTFAKMRESNAAWQ